MSGLHWLGCLAGGFYVLQSRISSKICFDPLMHTLSFCISFIDIFCNSIYNCFSAPWMSLHKNMWESLSHFFSRLSTEYSKLKFAVQWKICITNMWWRNIPVFTSFIRKHGEIILFLYNFSILFLSFYKGWQNFLR